MQSHENKIAPSENISANFGLVSEKRERVQETEIIFVRIWPDVGLMTFMSTKLLKNMPADREKGSSRTEQDKAEWAGWVSQVGGIFFWGATQSDRVGSGRDDSLVASNGQWGIFSFAEPANYRTRTYLAGMYYIMGPNQYKVALELTFYERNSHFSFSKFERFNKSIR